MPNIAYGEISNKNVDFSKESHEYDYPFGLNLYPKAHVPEVADSTVFGHFIQVVVEVTREPRDGHG